MRETWVIYIYKIYIYIFFCPLDIQTALPGCLVFIPVVCQTETFCPEDVTWFYKTQEYWITRRSSLGSTASSLKNILQGFLCLFVNHLGDGKMHSKKDTFCFPFPFKAA